MADLVDRARAAMSDRAEQLPGMTLMEHLDELRKRLIRSVIYLLVGFGIAYVFREQLFGIISKPIDDLHLPLNYTHPTDGLNLYLKTSLVGGAILASPFILYQLWLFISPGMYAKEKRYVVPFMTATVTLFLSGVRFGYHWVLPGALRVLITDFAKRFHPIITIEDYSSFFLAVILGLGVTFELPILIFFLSILGIVDAKFLIRHVRYAILIIFVIAAIICPLPDPVSMCLFAAPMLALYMVGVGVAWVFNPSRRKQGEAKPA
ncbi:MAG TPA: twin-arginine translocase subunit TatC [Edaphobacter sp.]